MVSTFFNIIILFLFSSLAHSIQHIDFKSNKNDGGISYHHHHHPTPHSTLSFFLALLREHIFMLHFVSNDNINIQSCIIIIDIKKSIKNCFCHLFYGRFLFFVAFFIFFWQKGEEIHRFDYDFWRIPVWLFNHHSPWICTFIRRLWIDKIGWYVSKKVDFFCYIILEHDLHFITNFSSFFLVWQENLRWLCGFLFKRRTNYMISPMKWNVTKNLFRIIMTWNFFSNNNNNNNDDEEI